MNEQQRLTPGRREPKDRSGLGTCYGYRIRSSLPFVTLRKGDGSLLEVTEGVPEAADPAGDPMLEWMDEAGRAIAQIHSRNGTFYVWIDQVGWFGVDPSIPSIAAPNTPGGIVREARLLGIPTVLCLVHRGDLPLHAASVDVDGSAIIIAAPGRHGKTTMAGAFVRAGYRLLSEDVACCRVDEVPSVLPGPALLRVRRDMYERLDFPGTDRAAEDEERVYLTIHDSARGDGSPVPIRGIVFLRPSEDEPAMERVTSEKTVPDLWTLTLKLPTDESRARTFQAITSIAGRVPIWNLHRRMSLEQLPEVVDRILSTCFP